MHQSPSSSGLKFRFSFWAWIAHFLNSLVYVINIVLLLLKLEAFHSYAFGIKEAPSLGQFKRKALLVLSLSLHFQSFFSLTYGEKHYLPTLSLLLPLIFIPFFFFGHTPWPVGS